MAGHPARKGGPGADISPAAPVVRLERLRRVNGVTHHLAESFVAEERFPDVLGADFT
ncbi:UTRA domain-containing protein, partial [Micromonospora humida]|uniref:UTRA domain-containing protein n=1 Tax=Micromonospora humida TaxID=2809018 RepID=UPI00366D9B0F